MYDSYSMTFFGLHVGLGLFVIRLMNNNLLRPAVNLTRCNARRIHQST